MDLFSNEVFGMYEEGIHYEMPDDEYHAIKAISNSSLKLAKRSMRHFKHWLDSGPVKQTDAMRWGTIVHLAVLEPDRFKVEVALTEAKDRRAKEYKEALEKPDVKYALTAVEADRLTGMITELNETKHAIDLIEGGKPEVTLLTTDPDTGLKIKCRMDVVNQSKAVIVDYKTTTDCKPTEAVAEPGEITRPSDFERHAYNLGYCNQAAFYLKFARQAGLGVEFFSLVVQEKDAPYLVQPYIYGFETIDKAAEENQKLLTKIAECAASGKWPGYSNRRLPLFRPYWGLKDD